MSHVNVIMYNNEWNIWNRKDAYMYSSDSENIPREITKQQLIDVVRYKCLV